MAKNNVYIWYSGATDITGKALQKELDITGGTKKPTNKDIVIGWGTKTKENVTLNNTQVVLNHPNHILGNRNKYTTLSKLKTAKVKVANFCSANEVLKSLNDTNSDIVLPLVGRKNYHQGGKGFWLCLTVAMVENAISEGSQYFQNYIDIVDEYRLHIFKGELLYAVKKVKRNNMGDAFIEQHTEKIKNVATKSDITLDEKTMKYVLGRLSKDNPVPDMIIRSNTRGWKFSHVKSVKNRLKNEAVKALEFSSLDFGAVDCCIDKDGNPWIIEINSGPGLKGTPFNTYVNMFRTNINNTLNPPPKTEKAEKVEKIFTKTAKVAVVNTGSVKEKLKAKAELFADMVEKADEEEAAVLQKLMGKMLA